jgi:hypothetical protein
MRLEARRRAPLVETNPFSYPERLMTLYGSLAKC